MQDELLIERHFLDVKLSVKIRNLPEAGVAS